MTEPSNQPWPQSPSTAPIERPLWTLVGPGFSATVAACQFAVLLGPLHGILQRDLGITNQMIAVVVVSHLVAAALGLALGYVIGRRAPTSVVASALMLMLVGAAVTAFSSTPIILLAAGFVAGLGEGAVLGTAAGLTSQVGQRRGPIRLTLGLAVLGGLVVGPLFGWFVSTALGWRWVYLLAVLMILAALIVTVIGGVVALMRSPKP